MPGPIKTANDQITGVVVQKLVGRSWVNMCVKGWAVMSRWGTSVPAKTPLLYVLDPKTDGEELSSDDADDLAQAIARTNVQQTAEGLGLLDSSIPMLRDMTRSARVVGDVQKRRFTGLLMTPMGPLNVDVEEARQLAARLPDASSIRFIGLPVELLDVFHDGRRIPNFSPGRLGQSASQGGDGLLSAPVMDIDDAS
ncbi:MAG: hypothetical protein EOP84_29870 [Verrucomicrobiaceae bacterium]|nr:MAG: hypothetical protein EOP84_29870 [Verrucomicrobiaceae bacterium]